MILPGRVKKLANDCPGFQVFFVGNVLEVMDKDFAHFY